VGVCACADACVSTCVHRHAWHAAATHPTNAAAAGPHSGAHPLAHVDLVADDEDGLIGKQRLDGVEQRGLLRDAVAALLADVHDVHAGGAQVGERGDGLRSQE